MNIDVIDRSLVDIADMVRVVRATPPERFDMTVFYNRFGPCGTSACVAGWSSLDPAIMQRYRGMVSVVGRFSLYPESGLADALADRMLPALDGGLGWARDMRRYIYATAPFSRSSAVDDEPFGATPVERAALGDEYAFGLAEREAALNRLRIVRACLERWREALVEQQATRAAPVAREREAVAS